MQKEQKNKRNRKHVSTTVEVCGKI